MPGTTVTPNTTIQSAWANAFSADVAATFNTAWPVSLGGNGVTDNKPLANSFGIRDNTDLTKLLAFDISGQTTAVTRTQKMPNYNGTLASQAVGTAIASASSIDLGGASGSTVHITGTTTITALGTADAGIQKTAIFDGILILTYNATSLILPGAANITTAEGDTAAFVSEGSGNWRCVNYVRASAQPLRPQAWETIAVSVGTGASQAAITSLSAYRRIRITGTVYFGTDNVSLLFQTSTNNGSSWDGGAGDYTWQYLRGVGAAVAAAADASATSISLLGTTSAGNNTGEGVQISISIEDFNQARQGRIICHAYTIVEDGSQAAATVTGRRTSVTARDAFRIYASSGTITQSLLIEGSRN